MARLPRVVKTGVLFGGSGRGGRRADGQDEKAGSYNGNHSTHGS